MRTDARLQQLHQYSTQLPSEMKLWKRRVAPSQPSAGKNDGSCVFKTKISNQAEHGNTEYTFFMTEAHPSSNKERDMLSFSDVVDEDERAVERRVRHNFVGWFVESVGFRLAMLLIILLNCLVIGIQTDRYLEDNYGAVFLALDKLFLTVFVLEILVKWYTDFLGFWGTGWNIFDFVIVTASILGPSLTFLSGSGVLRILRVLRALRSLKSISALRGLQIVVHTVIHSIPDMANIVALLLINMFIFAIIGLSLFGDNCPRHFGTLGSSMFALFVCVTQDGWMNIMEDLRQCGYYEMGAIYLLIFITIGAFVFANLVVAVVVTNLEWAIAEQTEMEQKQKPKKTASQKIKTVDAHHILRKLARQQTPLSVPHLHLSTHCLENYFLLLTALEDNLVEFKSLTDRLTEIVQEVHTLASLEDVSEDEIYHLGGISGSHIPTSSAPSKHTPPPSRDRRFFSLANTGDALSQLISLNSQQPQPSRRRASVRPAANMNTLLTQLAGHTHMHDYTPLNVSGILPLGKLPSNQSMRVKRSKSLHS